MNDFDALIQRYIAVWNETHGTARRRAVEQVWAPDAGYIDPLVVAQGHDAIDAAIRAFHGQFPAWPCDSPARSTPTTTRHASGGH